MHGERVLISNNVTSGNNGRAEAPDLTIPNR
jgi:hypothetical protein